MLLLLLADLAAPPDVVGAAMCARRCSTIERVREPRIGTITYRYVHIDIYVYIIRAHIQSHATTLIYKTVRGVSVRLDTICTKRTVVLKDGYHH